MRDLRPPFRFDLSAVLDRARRLPLKVDGVSIRLPFVNISVKPDDVERRASREIVIRLADRRVLNASECCNSCIDQALKSLQEVRALLVSKQVDLAGQPDGPVYLLLELMLEAIRQFFTFEQRLGRAPGSQQQYFAALEMLRAHIYRCLSQVAVVADIDIPKITAHMRYDDAWQVEAYEPPLLPDAEK